MEKEQKHMNLAVNSNEQYKRVVDEGIILEHSILTVCPQAKDKIKVLLNNSS